MDRLAAMRVFAAVAEAEGFAAAARRLGMSPPAVTRAVAALEDHIGARLLQRTTRHVHLTETGARYLADCRRILAEIEEADASAAGAHAEPRGVLGVTAPVMFGRMHVTPIVLDFLARYPRVDVRLVLLDRVVDLVEEGLDVAIRIAHLPPSPLRAVRVGSMRRVICASPDYLAHRGTPRTPGDLIAHDVISFLPMPSPGEWTFAAESDVASLTPHARLIANTADVAIAAAVAGRGLTRALSYQIAPQLSAGTLTIVLEDFEPPPVPIHIVHMEGRHAPARLRAFVDFAAERLRAEKSF